MMFTDDNTSGFSGLQLAEMNEAAAELCRRYADEEWYKSVADAVSDAASTVYDREIREADGTLWPQIAALAAEYLGLQE